MTRVAVLCAIILTVPSFLLAQHHGQGGAVSAGRPAGGSNDDLSDFKRAIALQASPDQETQFRLMTKSTAAAQTAAKDFLHLAGNASKPDLSQSADNLSNTAEEAQKDNARFLASFSEGQRSGLKDLLKKLGKANAEMTKQDKELARAHDRSDSSRITDAAEKIDKALVDFQSLQSAIGTEMGIKPEATTQGSSQ